MVLGLESCADTMIGDEMLRGISGGQKKRVTTEGQIVYQGPRENVLEFFGSMGFRCPERKGVADFLQEEMKAQGIEEDRLLLLKGVSGSFRPGVLTALMGVTGAGKTTLMDVLSGRKTGGYIEGDIFIAGYPKKQETFARVSGYCEQNDIHSPHVTVHESLVYSAWLRLSAEVDSATRMLIELKPLREALVGLPGVNGLSTEQRKRLTIAVELVANPSIIFMDEPTSGLDARAAAIVMRTVRNTVDTGRTVLFLMKRGGEEIYVGPIGHHSCHLIKYFEKRQDLFNAMGAVYTSVLFMGFYGLVTSQFGDVHERLDSGETVVEFLKDFFGFRHDFLGVVSVMVVGFAALFAFQFAVAIKVLNFQRR
ncbi:hypothetical protein GW17_00010904 [Ensete ventricosum]|nr:hypothetical protein GW17_00010904 [Ensete ventricosum]